MSDNTTQPQIPMPKKLATCYLGGLIGLIGGYVISFFFQNELIRMKLGFGGYLTHVLDVLTPSKDALGIAFTAWICMLIGAAVGEFVQLKLAESGKIPEPKSWQKLREKEAAKNVTGQDIS